MNVGSEHGSTSEKKEKLDPQYMYKYVIIISHTAHWVVDAASVSHGLHVKH